MLSDSNIYEAIECNYPGFGVPVNYTNWICGKYGTDLSCKEYGGSALTGVCGAGRREDCTKYCNGYHAVQCAAEAYIDINWGKCRWLTGGKGEWLYCSNGEIATGHCGSGENANCGATGLGIYHKLQCCALLF